MCIFFHVLNKCDIIQCMGNANGHIGLTIGILVSVLILGFMFTFWYTSDTSSDSVNSLQPKKTDGTAPKTKMEEYRVDIDAAKSIQNTVDESNKNIEDLL